MWRAQAAGQCCVNYQEPLTAHMHLRLKPGHLQLSPDVYRDGDGLPPSETITWKDAEAPEQYGSPQKKLFSGLLSSLSNTTTLPPQ